MILLILMFNVLLLVTLSNATTVELPSMINKNGECLPDYIFTDKPYISSEDSLVNPYYAQKINKTIINKNVMDSTQKDKMNSPNTVYIIEVDPKYAEAKPLKRIYDQEQIDLTKNNPDFITFRTVLDFGNEHSLNVKRLKLLPEITDTEETYWNRIHPYLFTSIVKIFKDDAEAARATKSDTSGANADAKAQDVLTRKKYISYILFVVGDISKQLNKRKLYYQLVDYLKNIETEPEDTILVEDLINLDSSDYVQEHDVVRTNSVKWASINKLKLNHNRTSWFREIRDYDPLQLEPYWSYMLRCYKRNKCPIHKNIISSYFDWSLDDDYIEFPIKYSTLLLMVLFTHPTNDLHVINFEDTANAKSPA